jgi:hypothetical protein
MSRFRKVALVGVVIPALLVGVILWVLPEIIRRAAVERISVPFPPPASAAAPVGNSCRFERTGDP